MAAAVQARADDPPIDWLTGPALRQQLAQPIKLSWSGVPIRRGLTVLARSQRVAILLDRRVDPGAQLRASLQDVPLEMALERLARAERLGLSWYGPLVYFGPPEPTRRLRTLAALRSDEAKSLPAKARLPFTRQRPWQWQDFATPRKLAEQLAAEAKIELTGLEQIPHDLWAAADLPPLSWIERLTLIGNEFDLTFEFSSDGGAVRLIPVPADAVIERTYAGGSDPEALARRWSQEAPEAEIKVADGKLVVRGAIEDHERLRGEQSRAAKAAAGGVEVYTLAVREQPLGPVLEELKRRLGLELHVDEAALQAADISLNRRVSFNVEQASLDELFQAALKPAGLTFRRREKTLDIFPAP
jgi:hypothetical protein